ncbi:MAG: aminotransferase class V-fold PLP-dependent enzyme [Spirochaetaceae bacterium]|jgi:O-acetylhomoserine/O-acetylserine sulfhydrylase-like pyridoxal-dependent enzyme|nr:aminotransferase class V-fold PLP-dependent enzyme [Spirochaetaceae bacterium]
MKNEKGHDISEKAYWVDKGQEMVKDRQRRIDRAKKWKFDTVATHGLYDLQQALEYNNGSIMEPVYLSPAQAYFNSAEMEAGLSYEMPNWCYSRIANPSSFFLEETAALLETYGTSIEAGCIATSSGMSAIRTATDPFLVKDSRYPNPNIVASAKVYGGTFQQFSVRRSDEEGVEVRWITDPTNINDWKSKIDKNTRFVYGEFPSNPSLSIFDIEEVSKLTKKFGIPLIVDSTCASPALTRPITNGADIVVHSASKVMGASGTSICGLLIAKKNILSTVGSDDMRADFATWTKFWPFRDNGPNINPMAAILILNDLRTLRMKVAQMSRTTMKVAQFLETHPKVDKVNYPGLESFPEKDLAEKYMKLVDSDEPLFGHMLSIEVKEDNPNDSKNSRKFYDNLDMIWRATDLGRVKTVATLNAISTHQQQGEEGRKLADIKPSTCRISCGVEDPEDIISDLRRALDSI